MQHVTTTPTETQTLAKEFVRHSMVHNVIALEGDLGGGKTTFVQGLAEGLGLTSPVTSPTFMLLKIYALRNHPQYKKLIHCDLYRVQGWNEIAELALDELWNDPTNLMVIEWSERIKEKLPAKHHHIRFDHQDGDQRNISISTVGN